MFEFDLPVPNSSVLAQEVRSNFNSLGTLNITANPDAPTNPRNGMPRLYMESTTSALFQIYFEGAWVTLAVLGSGTVAQARRKSQSFSSQSQWIFDHNLGLRPLVQVVLATGEVVLPEKIEHASVDRVIVTHAAPESGEIIVVG